MAGKDPQIEQAIEAVKRQPGSPAYAFLVEHYLEDGQDEEALRVAADGFAADPSFERGAVVYLTVLRRRGDLTAGGEVYGRAVAYLPRSARVRVAWALMLADAGKEREARNVAREALDLDPLNREARAFIATLGGTPAAQTVGRPPASPTARLAALAKDAVFDDSDLAQEGASQAPGSGPRAEVKPWVRPIGQRTTPHKMFDLTPMPDAMDPQHRRDLREADVVMSPVAAEPPPEAMVDVPSDLFEEPTAIDPPGTPQAGPAAAPASSATLLPAPPPAPTATPAQPPTPTPAPTPTAAAYPELFPGTPCPGPDTPMEPIRSRAEDSAATQESILLRSHNEIAPPLIVRTDLSLAASLRVRPARSSRARRLILVGIAAAVLAIGAVVGVRFVRSQALKRDVTQALESLRLDEPATYPRARQVLARLHRSHADDPQVGAALALVDAHLAVRFSAGAGAAGRARELLARLPAARPAMGVVASALLDAAEGKGAEALRQLQSTVGLVESSWQARLVAARAALAAGATEQAAQLLAAGLTLRPSAPALLEDAAIFYRRRGQLAEARQAVAEGLRSNPTHPGLRIQEALLGGSSPAPVTELTRLAGGVARLLAAVAVLQAREAHQRGETLASTARLEEAMRLDPSDPEAGVLLAGWRLERGGDAAQAEALLAKYGAAMARFRPGVALQHVQALLLLGRPQQAREELARLPVASLGPEDQKLLQVLEVRAAHWADDDAAVARACGSDGDNQDRGAVCVEAALERGRGAGVAARLRSIRDPGALAYLNGLRALAAGDTTRAITRLGHAGTFAVDPNAPLLALARAQARHGNPAVSVKLLREAVVRDARSVRSRVALALALVGTGHDTEARTLLESLLADRPTQPSLLAQTGEAFLAMGLPAKAALLVEQGITRDPGSVLIRLLAGRVALANGKSDEARRHFDEVLSRAPRHPEALIELGRLEEASGHGDQAGRRFAAALKQRPKDPELLFLVARAQARGGNPRVAVTNGIKAIRLLKGAAQDARAVEMMMELGRLLARGDSWARKRAEELFFEATKPKNAPALPFFELGRLYRSQGDLQRAVWCFRQAVERDPNLAEAYLELGRAMRGKPQWRREAKAALRRHLKLRPDSEEAPKVRSMIDKLR